MKTEAVHELTVAEIARLTGEFSRQRRSYTEELAALFAASEAGQAEQQPVTERAELVRNRAVFLLNGHSPEGLKLAVIGPRRQQIEVEIGALDLVLDTLSRKELVAHAEESAAFALEHGDEWAAICRDVLLCAARLGALEARAVAWRQNLGGVIPSTLPLAAFIGTGRSILGIPWGTDPLSRARTAALAEKIITTRELKDVENA
jgi:hypothetical protein